MRLPFALTIFLVATCPAQEAPELLRIAIAGPATWRTRLQPTDLGSMLASEAAETIWRGYVDAIDSGLRGLRGADAAFTAERARWLDYAGTLHVVFWLEQAEDALHVPRWSAALLAEPDGRTDLVAMAADSEQWLRRIGDAASNAWRDVRPGPPQVHDGRMCVVFAGDEDRERANARALTWRTRPLDPRDAMRVEVEAPAMLGLLSDRAAERGIATDLLGPATQRLTFTLGAFGPDLALTARVHTAATGERGLFAALAPIRSGVPELSGLLPDNTTLRGSWRVDWTAAWRTFCTAWAGLRDESVAAGQSRWTKVLGVDLDKDVLPHLRDDVLLVCSAPFDGPGSVPFTRTSLVVPVRDSEKLVAALEPLVKRLGGFVWHDEAGAWSCRISGVFSVYIVVADGVLCLGSTEYGPGLARQVYDRVAVTGVPPPKFVDAGDGISGTGLVDVESFLHAESYAALRLLPALLGAGLQLPPRAAYQAQVERWLPLLRQHRLDQASVQLRTGPNELTVRLLW
jgi:hypothetical protein